jgi:maltose alpha-D-glucosyltransferase/alpha-amylase
VGALRPPPGKLAKTRFHGDLHLGQVLVAQDDFVIVDFEGEPARPFAERRQKSSPLRDVAGMLRSFSYAANAALLKVQALQRESAASPAAQIDEWEGAAIDAFLDGYRQFSRGLASVPADENSLQATLALCVAERALQDLNHEMEDRPEWIHLPIRQLLKTAASR